MEKKELQSFIYFFTRNKSLSKAQQQKRDELLVRDELMATGELKLGTPEEAWFPEDANKEIKHAPRKVVEFLRQFTMEKTDALKLTVHVWEKNRETNIYPYTFIEGEGGFKEAYKRVLNDDSKGYSLSEIQDYCPHLATTINGFLLPNENLRQRKGWSEHLLKIGYDTILDKWMKEHEGMQPFSMPLDYLPEFLRPKKRINGKTLVYFSNVVTIFKQCIEFRDDNLYYTLLNLFGHSDLIIDKVALQSTKGRSLYTDTELVKEALRIIASNIKQRSQFLEVYISCESDEEGRIVLKILQKGSFSNRDIRDSKLNPHAGIGDMGRIIERLQNLCDFSIESKFRVDNELHSCRINYLSSVPNIKPWEFLDNECEGFTYVLTFYTQ